jgi:acyl-CoA synthetase (AMP-forming)/AMP-acid ligase II
MPRERFVDPRPSVPFSCLPRLLEHLGERIPDAPAILAPGRAPLTYGRLCRYVDETGGTLRALGIGRRDRIVVMLPNGPEMAAAILSVASHAICAPFNPAYRAEELDRYFFDLQPRALITQAGSMSEARRVALARGIRVIELSTTPDAKAGLFTLTGERGNAARHEPASPVDVALLMLTSGTTARPKIVPLTHVNICTSVFASIASLALKETDRCLNVLPLFHGHGLVATVLTSLAAGAGVVCAPGCDADSFLGWLTEFQPTWYSAVPTMHQAILAHARNNRQRLSDARLRFVRSASAPLPARVFTELEQAFEAPLIEFYGMTESASAPIACNPLPPGRRKIGSVGVPVGLDVAIINEEGSLLPAGQPGQIMIRGASVMRGYDGSAVTTETAFTGEWFKTRDRGFFDDDGYLFLAGRVEEMINRGGEKIAPREVDEVLLEHPAVVDAVTFSIPHATLGEDVASAVVLRPDAVATAKDLRQFVVGRVADFKVPRQVLIVKEFPKGPTGKIQRVDLAAKLELASRSTVPPFMAPRNRLEEILAGIWADVLHTEQVGIHDNFFALGGDSLLATHVLARIHNRMHVEVEMSQIFEAPTVAELAHHLDTLIKASGLRQSPAIVRVSRNGEVPASIAQEWLWNLQHALRDLPFFNVLYALRLTSSVNSALLERSINEIVQRHEILRTTLTMVDGRCVQVIATQLNVPLKIDDLQSLPKSKKEAVGQNFIQQEALHSFDLEKGPLIRARLVRLAEHEHLLLVNMHQVVCDGWSLGVFVEELGALYDAFCVGKASPLAPLSIQYADFACWQRNWRSHPDIVAQLNYWREQLRDPLPVMRLATGRPPQKVDDFRTSRREVMLPDKLFEAAKRFSQREGVTLFMTLAAAFKTLLHRYTGEEDLRMATHLANRNRPDTEALLGRLVNTVILRTNLNGDPSSREVIHRVRTTTLAAFANQDLPFEEVIKTLERERALKPAAVAQVMMWLQNAALRPTVSDGGGLAFEEATPGMLLPLVTITTFDIVIMLRESTEGLVGTCLYKPHLFNARAIDRLLRDFRRVLEHMIVEPEQSISAIPITGWRR